MNACNSHLPPTTLKARTQKSKLQRFIAGHLRELHKLERFSEPRFASDINQAVRDIAARFEQGADITLAITRHEQDVLSTVRVLADRAALVFYPRGLVSVGVESKRLSPWQLAAQRYIALYGLRQAKTIAATLFSDVNDIISSGVRDGLATPRIAANIAALTGTTATRARRIALTESHNAAIFASDAAVRDTGVDMEKKWVSVEDARTRPEHAAVDAQGYIAIDKPFMVGGVPMMHPGDPAGGAANVINCRCAVVYRPAGFDINDYL